jgi:hypothetical protein
MREPARPRSKFSRAVKRVAGNADTSGVKALRGPRARAFIIIGVLALAAVGAGLMLFGRHQASGDAAPPPAPPASTTPAAPAVGGGATSALPTTTVPGAAARTPAAATPGDNLPVAIKQALASNHVVVVALYDPQAAIDDTALKEAGAGAQLAGVTFVPVDVSQNDVDSLNARYGVIQDPAVLVLRPPGDLVVRIDGFADRDTVAQAAANAAQ